MCCFRRYFNASQSLSALTSPINYTWNSLTYKNAFTWPTDEKGKMMGKSPELFSYSYEFLFRNCNKIYCFIKACWNLFSKSPASQAINFSLSYGDNMGAGICTQLFCFLGEHGGIKQSPFTTHFCCSLCALSCSICVCSEFLQSLFFFTVLIGVCMFRIVGTNEQTCAYLCISREGNCSQLALPGMYLSNHQYYV